MFLLCGVCESKSLIFMFEIIIEVHTHFRQKGRFTRVLYRYTNRNCVGNGATYSFIKYEGSLNLEGNG